MNRTIGCGCTTVVNVSLMSTRPVVETILCDMHARLAEQKIPSEFNWI